MQNYSTEEIVKLKMQIRVLQKRVKELEEEAKAPLQIYPMTKPPEMVCKEGHV